MRSPALLFWLSVTLLSSHTVCAQGWLDRYDLAGKDPVRFKLPRALSEASGLAMTADGRLLIHDDESPIVYEVNYRDGSIVKRFTIGSGFMKEDLEGIAVKGDTLYLVSSDGKIFEFREGKNKGRVKFTLYRTPLTRRNDVEGLEYDPETDCLLLACKGDAALKSASDEEKERLSNSKAVYAFSLMEKKLLPGPRFLIPKEEVAAKAHKGSFNPSGMARHPVSDTFFIISADGASIIELSRDGKLLGQEVLPRSVHSQPEGITFAPDLSMIICNDVKDGRGTLVVYGVK